MKRAIFLLFFVSILFSSSTVRANEVDVKKEKKLVNIEVDLSKNKISLSTEEKGKIVYAFKVSGGTILDLDGNEIDDGEKTAGWAVKNVDKNGKEELYSEEKGTWSIYDSKTFDTDRLITGGKYVFLYTAIKYDNGEFSESQYDKIVMSEERPVVNADVQYSGIKATINVSVDSNVGIDYISNAQTDELVRGKKSVSFVVDKNGVYMIQAMNVLGFDSTIAVTVSDIDYKKEQNKEEDIEDKTNPVIKLENIIKDKVKSFNIIITAEDKDSDLSYIELPSGYRVESNKAEFLIKENGEYIFKARDVVGNEAIKKLVVNNIVEASNIGTDNNKEDFTAFLNKGEGVVGTLPQTGGVSLAVILAVISGVSIVSVVLLIVAKKLEVRVKANNVEKR